MARLRLSTFILISALAIQCYSAPAPLPNPDPAPGLDNRPEIIEIIAPSRAAQETLETLYLGEPNSEQGERNKRTIGILRQLFPSLSQIIDQKIQQIVSVLFRTIGRTILQGALGGGGGGGGASGTTSNNGGKVSVSLPAYGPDDDDDSDEDDSDDSSPANLASRFGAESSSDAQTTTPSVAENEVQTSNTDPSEQSLSESSDPSGSESNATTEQGSSASTPTTTETVPEPPTTVSTSSSTISSSTSTSPSADTTAPILSNLPNVNPDMLTTSTSPATAAVNGDENLLSEAESQQSEVRVQFTDPDGEKAADSKADDADQDSAASGGNNGAIDDLSLDDADSSDENRNKRFLNFGFGGGDSSSSGSGSGSGGGSGNFLFDIIRLVAGSGGTEQSDEASASADGTAAKGDGYTEGIPGPVTRLFIIANRGISNLIQDLILRIAQTSERLVNFKARLITSII